MSRTLYNYLPAVLGGNNSGLATGSHNSAQWEELSPQPIPENLCKLAGIVANISSAVDNSTDISVQVKTSLRECTRKLQAECAKLRHLTQLAHRAAHDATNVLRSRINFFEALDNRIRELSRLRARFVDSRQAFHGQPHELLRGEIRNSRGHVHDGMLSGLKPLFDRIDKQYNEVNVSLYVEEECLKKIRRSLRVTPDDKRRWELIRNACIHASNQLTAETPPTSPHIPQVPQPDNKAARHIQVLAQTVTDARRSLRQARRNIADLTQHPQFGLLRLQSEYENGEVTCRQRISEVLEYSEHFLGSFAEVPPLDDFRDHLLPTAASESSHILQEVRRQMTINAHAVLNAIPELQGSFTRFDRYLPSADASMQRMYGKLQGLVQPLEQPEDPHQGVFRTMRYPQLREEQGRWRSLEDQWEAQLHL